MRISDWSSDVCSSDLGSVRSSKTLSAESMLLRNLTYGPSGNILWFMQDNDSLNDYIDERGEEMLAIHPEVFEKIDWDDSRNTSRTRKIGRASGRERVWQYV